MEKIKRIILYIISYLIYYSGIWYALLKLNKKSGLLVVNYHNFSTYTNDFFEIGSIYQTDYAKNFEKQIQFYNKYFNLKDSPLIEDADYTKLSIILTFDDGYKDNYDIAFPILKKYNAAAIFFISTNVTDTENMLWHDKFRYLAETEEVGNNKIKDILLSINNGINKPESFNKLLQRVDSPRKRIMMNWEEIKEIGDDPLFLIGAHTVNHLPLKNEQTDIQKDEIFNSIKDIENNIRKECKEYFSYPNGLYDLTTLSILKDLKLRYAFTTENGLNTKKSNPYQLKRIGINPSDPIPFVGMKILKSIFI